MMGGQGRREIYIFLPLVISDPHPGESQWIL